MLKIDLRLQLTSDSAWFTYKYLGYHSNINDNRKKYLDWTVIICISVVTTNSVTATNWVSLYDLRGIH